MPRFHGIPFHDSSPNHNVINERICFRRQKLFTRSHGNRHPLASGSRYSTITNQQGYYQLQGMRTGGPYQIDISYVGFRPSTGKGIYLQLAIPYTYNTVLIPSTDLEEVVVKSTISKYSNGKTGASTHVGSAQIKLLPNVTRSLTDILKLTPYSRKWFRRTRSTHEQLQCRRGKF